jgi:hypothetical protein
LVIVAEPAVKRVAVVVSMARDAAIRRLNLYIIRAKRSCGCMYLLQKLKQLYKYHHGSDWSMVWGTNFLLSLSVCWAILRKVRLL